MRTTVKKMWVWRDSSGLQTTRDHLTVEEPLEIRLDTRPLMTTMRTPGEDEELAAGLLYSEAIVRRAGDIQAIRHYSRNRQGNVLDVFLAARITVDWEGLARHGYVTSSCGLCGKTSIEAVRQQFKPVTGRSQVRADRLVEFPGLLRRHQEAFSQTGGLHAAAIFTLGGKLVVVREDVGRHNAVDKVIGYGLLQGRLPWNRHVLMVSGRASFEIVQKALAARIPVVAAISAPSSLAVELARENGQTLVGFLRGSTMNVYSHADRLLGNPGNS